MTTVEKVRALRGEVESVLARKVDGVPVAGTLGWLTRELGGEGVKARGFVLAVLQDLQKEGLVTTRRLRSGETLWKLTDQHHEKWEQYRTLGTSAGLR
jgi:hypothetical protein